MVHFFLSEADYRIESWYGKDLHIRDMTCTTLNMTVRKLKYSYYYNVIDNTLLFLEGNVQAAERVSIHDNGESQIASPIRRSGEYYDPMSLW